MVVDISLTTLRTIRSGQSGLAISATGWGGVRHGSNLADGVAIARAVIHAFKQEFLFSANSPTSIRVHSRAFAVVLSFALRILHSSHFLGRQIETPTKQPIKMTLIGEASHLGNFGNG
jgi:hypothetical protein